MTSFLGRISRVPLVQRTIDALAPNRSAAAVTKHNTREAYETVYGSDRLLADYLTPERVEFFEELARLIAPLQPRSVVDVGCGTGHLLRLLVDGAATPPERIVGIDHAEEGINRARELLPSAIWIVGDMHSWSGEEEFDLVLCTEVLEHLEEPQSALKVLRDLCAPGGRILITVPDGAQDSWEGHVNFWDESALTALLDPHGLTHIDRVDGGRTLLAWLERDDTST